MTESVSLDFPDFIHNINELDDNDDLKFEALDILSLKMKRTIAVKWPYGGYLGKVGTYRWRFIFDERKTKLSNAHVNCCNWL